MKNSIVLDWAWCQGNREYHPPSCYCADLCIIPWETQRKCKNKKTKKNPIHALHICKPLKFYLCHLTYIISRASMELKSGNELYSSKPLRYLYIFVHKVN